MGAFVTDEETLVMMKLTRPDIFEKLEARNYAAAHENFKFHGIIKVHEISWPGVTFSNIDGSYASVVSYSTNFDALIVNVLTCGNDDYVTSNRYRFFKEKKLLRQELLDDFERIDELNTFFKKKWKYVKV